PSEFEKKFGWQNDPNKVSFASGPAPAIAKLGSDPGRKAGEWALSLGARITIRSDEQVKVIKDVKELPDYLFDVVEVDFSSSKIDDKDTPELKQQLSKLMKLKLLNLSRTNVGDAGVAQLAELTTLQEVHLSLTKVTDVGLLQLGKLGNLT